MYQLDMTARQIERLLGAEGFELVKVRGSHHHDQKGRVRTILPFHSGEVPGGTAKSILAAVDRAREDEGR